MNMPLEFDTIQ